jgi:hypothetical protein
MVHYVESRRLRENRRIRMFIRNSSTFQREIGSGVRLAGGRPPQTGGVCGYQRESPIRYWKMR